MLDTFTGTENTVVMEREWRQVCSRIRILGEESEKKQEKKSPNYICIYLCIYIFIQIFTCLFIYLSLLVMNYVNKSKGDLRDGAW